MKGLKTKRLVIVPLSDAELELVRDGTADAHDRAAYAQMLDGCRAHPGARLFHTAWEIRTRDGVPVGDACFKGAPDCGEVEIGYAIGAAHRGQGYAEEAARALVDWAFGQEGVYVVTAECKSANAASRRVLEKLGFTPAGEGAEGPRFELEKPEGTLLALFLPLGVGVGMCFGVAFGNLVLGMCIGLAIGAGVGTALAAADRRARNRAKQQRANRQ